MEDEVDIESTQSFDNQHTEDFQRYLQPNSDIMSMNFEDMDPNELPGQQYTNSNQQNQSLQRDMFGDEELIQIDNNQEGNSAAYQRSRPDGSPMFSQSSGFIAGGGDTESVVFRPIRTLDFSALDDTAMTDVILPRGMNRSASTPDHKNKAVSMITREQFIENTGIDRNESPDGNFFPLKSSPNQSSPEEELDSKVIFSPLHDGNNFQRDQFDPGMKSPPLSKHMFGNNPQNSMMQQERRETGTFELTQQTLNDTEISPYGNTAVREHAQQFMQNFSPMGSLGAFKKASPTQSPHHHSISPKLQNNQPLETREIFVSLPQHLQYGHSPDSLDLSVGNSRMKDFENMDQNYENEHNIQFVPVSQQQSNKSQIPKIQPIQNRFNNETATGNQNNMQNSMQNQKRSISPSSPKNAGNAGNRADMPVSGKDTNKQQTASLKQETKLVDKKPWNYAKGTGNKEPPSFLEKGAHKREVLAQQAKARAVREEPKGKVQDKVMQQPAKPKQNPRMGSGHSAENINKGQDTSVQNRNVRQATQGQSRSVPGAKGHTNQNQIGGSGGIPKPVRPEQGQGRSVEHKSKGEYSPVTQMEQYSDAHDSSLDVQGMEDVRSQLKSMLKISTGDTTGKSFDFDGNYPSQQDPYYGHAGQVDFSMMSGNSQDNVSELLENFPSITACMWTDNSSINRNDVSVHNENTRLREMLEKERYRRKHCEQQIQKLNIKILEIQQQLAVAVSTDKRKDIMIEQLDKQLGKVLEGWKQQDHEKSINLEKVKQEKKNLEDTIHKQQKVIESFEQDMARALDAVRQERDDAEGVLEELRSQIEENERNRKHAEEMLETEREKAGLTKQELDMIKDNRDQIDKKFQQLQDRMYQEQDNWFKREQELLNKIDEVAESNVKVLQQEKDKNEELGNRNKQMEEEIHEIQKIIKKMEMEHDAVQREKESLKVEMGIMEAKFASAQRTLEAELASHMEKEIADQMSDLQKRVEKADSELREKHYEHTKELNQRHKEDLEKHLANFHRQLKDKDDENRKQVQEYEEKLQAYRAEISTLQETKQKLEKQRTDILLKLQQMMQSQWNEALSLLQTTPQRKRGQFNGPSKSLGSEFSLPQTRPDTGNSSALHISDLTSREPVLSESQRGNNSNIREDNPMTAEINMTDFQTLHMQQLLQSLSGLTTQQFPAYGTGPPVSQNHPPQLDRNLESRSVNTSSFQDPNTSKPVMNSSNYQEMQLPNSALNLSVHQDSRVPQSVVNSSQYNDPHQTGPVKSFSSSLEESKPHSYPSSPNSKTVQSRVPQSPPQTNYHPYNGYQVDENDDFNTHLQMLLNANQPNPVYNPSSRNESVNYGHDTVNSNKPTQRQTSQESVDHWLRQSQRSHDQSVVSHDLNRSHVSHVSYPDEYSSQMGMAVPIRPPQQHESFIGHPEAELPSHHQESSRIAQHPQGACYSPPTKQTRNQSSNQETDSLLNESVQLARNYNEISDRVEEHENKHGELQHYIQMLLQKPPGDPIPDPDENASLFSHQTEEPDLNDTAQAAQIQRELFRIQELRNKPGVNQDQTDRKAVTFANGQGSKAVGNSLQGILPPGHIAEISRYLEKHKEHLSGNTEEDEQLAEVVNLLKNIQKQGPQRNVDAKQLLSPKSPRDKVKRNLKGQMSKVPDSVQGKVEGNPSQANKPQGPQAKKERKVASVGPNRHIQGGKGGKNAWK